MVSKNVLAQETDVGPAIRLALQKLQVTSIAFHRTIASGIGEHDTHSINVAADTYGRPPKADH